MTGTDPETGESEYEKGTLRDLVPWCQVQVIGEFTQIYASGAGWGPNFDAIDVLIFEPDPDDMGDQEEEEEEGFAFAGVGKFTKRKAEDGEGESGAAATDASTGEGGGDEGGGGGGGGGAGGGGETTEVDKHIGKRTRTSVPSGEGEPYSDDDGN